jgi:type I restriction enzyme S subunit
MTEPWPLPESWRWAEWDSVARVASNLVDPADHQSLPHIAPNHIESGTGKLLPYRTVGEDEVISSKHLFSSGHILYSKIRPYLAKAVIVDFPGLCSADMYPVETSLESRYLKWWMLCPEFTRLAAGEQARTVLPKINKHALGQLPVPVPPLDEQRRIVDLLEDHLSRLDAASDYLEASRRRLVALERSALDVHFGGEHIALADLIDEISAGKSFGAASAPARENEWGIIKVSAMTWGKFDPTENKAVTDERQVDPRFEIRSGDLLVSRANTSALVGASVLVRDVRSQLLLSDKSLRLTPRSEVDAEWLWRALQAPSARRQISALATGTKDSMRNISQAALKQILLPNADRSRQARALDSFREVADAIALLHGEIERGITRLDALRRSLLAAAFSGRLTGSEGVSVLPAMIDA